MQLGVEHLEQRMRGRRVGAVRSFDERRDVVLHVSFSLSRVKNRAATLDFGAQPSMISKWGHANRTPSLSWAQRKGRRWADFVRLLTLFRPAVFPLLRIGYHAERGCEIDLVILLLLDQLLEYFRERVLTELFRLANALTIVLDRVVLGAKISPEHLLVVFRNLDRRGVCTG